MKDSYTTSIVRILFISLFFVFTKMLSAQNIARESNSTLNYPSVNGITALIERQTEFLRASYSRKNEPPEKLINGTEYESYYSRSKVKPLLFPDKPRTASAITKTRRFNNLILQYDTFLDEVIYTDTSKMLNFRYPQIALNKNIIDGFNLYFKDDSLIFRYLRKPGYSDKKLKEGFYEIAYEGASRFVIKHESSFYEREGLVNYKYSPVNYISVGHAFYPVKNRKNLLRLMDDKSKEIKKYIHASGIRIGQASRNQIVMILKYYDFIKGS
jgi:hypothetical protein